MNSFLNETELYPWGKLSSFLLRVKSVFKHLLSFSNEEMPVWEIRPPFHHRLEESPSQSPGVKFLIIYSSHCTVFWQLLPKRIFPPRKRLHWRSVCAFQRPHSDKQNHCVGSVRDQMFPGDKPAAFLRVDLLLLAAKLGAGCPSFRRPHESCMRWILGTVTMHISQAAPSQQIQFPCWCGSGVGGGVCCLIMNWINGGISGRRRVLIPVTENLFMVALWNGWVRHCLYGLKHWCLLILLLSGVNTKQSGRQLLQQQPKLILLITGHEINANHSVNK